MTTGDVPGRKRRRLLSRLEQDYQGAIYIRLNSCDLMGARSCLPAPDKPQRRLAGQDTLNFTALFR